MITDKKHIQATKVGKLPMVKAKKTHVCIRTKNNHAYVNAISTFGFSNQVIFIGVVSNKKDKGRGIWM